MPTPHRRSLCHACPTTFLVALTTLVTPASSIHYDECGQLVPGVECVLFQPDGPPFVLLFIENMGSFGVGAHVRVQGELVTGCFTLCMQEDACVLDNCIALCPLDCCVWDLNSDDDVGVRDFLQLLAQWGMDPGGPPDFNGNGVVGMEDFLELLNWWGPCP
jgi:hypothetical protein